MNALRSSAEQPFVSIVTPFHNTDDYLETCIKSVLAQTHVNFEFVLVDNCSTDRSLEIAASYAAADERIRLVRTDRLLPQMVNYNFALAQISSHSSYCKIVQADDWIYPPCIEQMSDLAARHPNVGLVSSYRHAGVWVDGAGIDPERDVLSGWDAARGHLLGEFFVFGTQTTMMYRSDLVRERPTFFAVDLYQSDVDAAYSLLRVADFGFVHQVLSYSRVEEGSTAARRERYNARDLDYLVAVTRHGDHFLQNDELHAVRSRAEKKYYQAYASAWVRCARRGEAAAMVQHNREVLAVVGRRVRGLSVAEGAVRAAGRLLACPARLTRDHLD